MLLHLYQKLIPHRIRKAIYRKLKRPVTALRRIRVQITAGLVYRCTCLFPAGEYRDAYRFLGAHGLSPYPFEESLKYRNMPVEVIHDTATNLPCVMHRGKRLYWPRGTDENTIRNAYRSLITEQDSRSAHRYVASYELLNGKTLLDIGAAEGIFTLNAIEHIAKAYLFECKECWSEPLAATFAPWKERITIIKQYVSDSNSPHSITLDTFMQNREHSRLHIKMDIEGAEQQALKGAATLLRSGQQISASICTYHRKDDAAQISRLLQSAGYTCSFTQGYFMAYPHLRHGVCRADNAQPSC